MVRSCITTATLSNKRMLILDEPIPLPIGRVRVVIEQLPSLETPADFLSKLHAIHQDLNRSGHSWRQKEEIDAQIAAERDGWDR